jgi:hypothetical protein
LSFCDPAAPAGQRFRGVCIVEVNETDAAEALIDIAVKFPHALPGAEWIAAATRKAWREGCNPGGEVASLELTPGSLAKLPASLPRNRLLNKTELQALGVEKDTR